MAGFHGGHTSKSSSNGSSYHCPYCGKRVSKKAIECRYCGARIKEEE